VIASAPGKLMVAGEYAVLHGRPALVVAVDRRATVRARQASEGAAGFVPPEAVGAWEAAVAAGLLSAVPEGRSLAYDLSALGHDGTKLGLGSSGAVCTAALAWALGTEGCAATDPFTMARVARTGHRNAQGGGSGVDVLASALGGVVRVQFPDGLDAEPVVRRVVWPEGLYWAVLWAGQPVATAGMLAAVRAWQGRDRHGADAALGALGDAGEAACEAVEAGDVRGAVKALDAAGEAMRRLGEGAGVAIVTPMMQKLADEGRPFGVAVKPSGAGGGDVVVAFAHDAEALARVCSRAEQHGWMRIAVGIDPRGASVDEGARQ